MLKIYVLSNFQLQKVTLKKTTLVKDKNKPSQLQLIETRVTRSHKPDRAYSATSSDAAGTLKPINPLRELPRPFNYDNVSREYRSRFLHQERASSPHQQVCGQRDGKLLTLLERTYTASFLIGIEVSYQQLDIRR